MKGTQTTLYFSKWQDSDLVSLYYQIGRKSFIKVMKESLRVLVRVGYEPTFTKTLNISPTILVQDNEETEGDTFECNDEPVDNPSKDAYKSFSLIVSFASAKDVDVLNLLYSIKPKKMGVFIKKAMRFLIGPYYVLGCMLEGDSKINDAYSDRKLFFVNSNVVTPIVAKSEKPRKVKKANTKKEEDTVEKIVASSTKMDSQPSSLDFGSDYGQVDEPNIPQQTGGESGFIDDDDILSILENM